MKLDSRRSWKLTWLHMLKVIIICVFSTIALFTIGKFKGAIYQYIDKLDHHTITPLGIRFLSEMFTVIFALIGGLSFVAILFYMFSSIRREV